MPDTRRPLTKLKQLPGEWISALRMVEKATSIDAKATSQGLDLPSVFEAAETIARDLEERLRNALGPESVERAAARIDRGAYASIVKQAMVKGFTTRGSRAIQLRIGEMMAVAEEAERESPIAAVEPPRRT